MKKNIPLAVLIAMSFSAPSFTKEYLGATMTCTFGYTVKYTLFPNEIEEIFNGEKYYYSVTKINDYTFIMNKDNNAGRTVLNFKDKTYKDSFGTDKCE
tara:strand:+ start:28 stop:321 length:294 start_codon:yes stop_codon:yes gene_type:complete